MEPKESLHKEITSSTVKILMLATLLFCTLFQKHFKLFPNNRILLLYTILYKYWCIDMTVIS